MTEQIRVKSLDFDPVDAGFTILPNYTARFWFPIVGTPTAVGLYVILLVHADQDGHAWPSISTIADMLRVDRRSITGRTQLRDGRTHRYFGAIDQLEKHGLLRTQRIEPDDGNPSWNFYVRKRPPVLTPTQVNLLPERLQHAHDRWIKRHLGGGEYHPGGWCTPEGGVVSTTRIRTNQQEPKNKTLNGGSHVEANPSEKAPPWGLLQAWPEIATLLTEVARPDNRPALLRALNTLRPVRLDDGTLTLRGPRHHAELAAPFTPQLSIAAAAALSGIAHVDRIEILGPDEN